MSHERPIIHPTAQIANNVTFGPYTVIGPNVTIGEGTVIGSHVVIQENTRIGKHNHIHQFASIGGHPQHAHYKGEQTFVEIGDHNTIGEFCTINRGIADEHGSITRLGHGNFLMSYVHIAHNCTVGNHTIFANNASIAGHVVVDDYVVLSGFAIVHQFCYIGAYSFLRAGTAVPRDIMPYIMVNGRPTQPCGLNTAGLKRRGFSSETISQLKKAYRLLFLSSTGTSNKS